MGQLASTSQQSPTGALRLERVEGVQSSISNYLRARGLELWGMSLIAEHPRRWDSQLARWWCDGTARPLLSLAILPQILAEMLHSVHVIEACTSWPSAPAPTFVLGDPWLERGTIRRQGNK